MTITGYVVYYVVVTILFMIKTHIFKNEEYTKDITERWGTSVDLYQLNVQLERLIYRRISSELIEPICC